MREQKSAHNKYVWCINWDSLCKKEVPNFNIPYLHCKLSQLVNKISINLERFVFEQK